MQVDIIGTNYNELDENWRDTSGDYGILTPSTFKSHPGDIEYF